MKTLLLMRHAKSSWAEMGQSDLERPLNDRGRRDAPRMGQWLKAQAAIPDLIISSHARRAVETAECVMDATGYGGDWRREPRLYEAEAEDYYAVLQALPDTAATVLVVAHNPGSEDLLEALTGQPETMKTACVAVIELPIESWLSLQDDTSGRLGQFGCPHELD